MYKCKLDMTGRNGRASSEVTVCSAFSEVKSDEDLSRIGSLELTGWDFEVFCSTSTFVTDKFNVS